MKRVLPALVLLALVAAAVPAARGQASGPYLTLTDLGVVTGAFGSMAHAINNAGQVVGWTQTEAPGPGHFARAFVWTPGAGDGDPSNPQMKDLGTLGGTLSFAYGINDAGQTVGESYTKQQILRAFIWSGGPMTDLTRKNYTHALDISNAGPPHILGATFSSPWVLQNGPLKYLEPLVRNQGRSASAVNVRGQAVGKSGSLAVIWNGATPTSLGTLPGGGASEALTINDLNPAQVVGASETLVDGALTTHATLWEGANPPEDLHALGVSSTAQAINNRGEVLGTYHTAAGQGRRFIWDRVNGMRDLDALIDPQSGWRLAVTIGLAINDLGQIATTGIHPGDNQYRAVILALPPAP